jgi:hypothetical protein
MGDTMLAAHWRARAERLKEAIRRTFWCEAIAPHTMICYNICRYGQLQAENTKGS